MSKKFLLLIAALMSVLLIPSGTSAHELIRDGVGGAGALIYINPNDDPVAGQAATIFFEISDSTIALDSPQVSMTITDEHGASAAVPTKVNRLSLSGSYVFPKPGSYEIKLTVKRGDQIVHMFSESKQVSRSTTDNQKVSNAHLWARFGLAVSVITAVLVMIIAFRRRKVIRQYSKL